MAYGWLDPSLVRAYSYKVRTLDRIECWNLHVPKVQCWEALPNGKELGGTLCVLDGPAHVLRMHIWGSNNAGDKRSEALAVLAARYYSVLPIPAINITAARSRFDPDCLRFVTWGCTQESKTGSSSYLGMNVLHRMRSILASSGRPMNGFFSRQSCAADAQLQFAAWLTTAEYY